MIPSLSEPHLCSRPKQERLTERKAVTIGVGFLCTDGIVLCADRQITDSGGFKYEERKIFRSLTKEYSLIYSYAGQPDTAKVIFQRLRDALGKCTFPKDDVRACVEEIYKDKMSKEIKTLIGIRIEDVGRYFFRTSKARVVDGGVAEHIGIGDSSAVRYLCDFLLRSQPSIHDAQIIGSYIVSVANRYVESCGGGPDITTLWFKGTLQEGSGGVFPNQKERFMACEEQIGRGLRELLLSGGTAQLGIMQPDVTPSVSQRSKREP